MKKTFMTLLAATTLLLSSCLSTGLGTTSTNPTNNVLGSVLGNILLGGNCLMLSNNFNYQLHCDNSDLDDDVKIIHYIWKKPWNADYPGYLDEPFWNEAVSCGFGKEYKRYKRQRKMNFYKNELIPAAMSKIKRKK